MDQGWDMLYEWAGVHGDTTRHRERQQKHWVALDGVCEAVAWTMVYRSICIRPLDSRLV